MRRFASALVLVVGLASGAQAALNGERFENDATKLAVDLVRGKARLLCVCQDGSANNRHVGYLIKSTYSVSGGLRVTMTCQLPTLSTLDRSVVSTQNCLTFEILQK